MIIAGTGHRPDKIRIGPLDAYHPAVANRLAALARAAVGRLAPSLVISGIAQGWDTALAQAALDLRIPFDAHVPFIGQESRWPPAAQRRYHALLGSARRVVITSPGGYSAVKMHIRNVRMVDDSDVLLALWDGSRGGTFNCVDYAVGAGRRIEYLWRHWVRHASTGLWDTPPPRLGALI